MKGNVFAGLQKKITAIKEEEGKWLDPKKHKFDYETLKNTFPEGVDPAKK